jgi:hypothetical protein
MGTAPGSFDWNGGPSSQLMTIRRTNFTASGARRMKVRLA